MPMFSRHVPDIVGDPKLAGSHEIERMPGESSVQGSVETRDPPREMANSPIEARRIADGQEARRGLAIAAGSDGRMNDWTVSRKNLSAMRHPVVEGGLTARQSGLSNPTASMTCPHR